jgi:radial spoke head protein 4A
VNTYVYWVTDSLFADWIQLPDVQPEQIVVASMIKRCFTGNLNANIESSPPFPGKERHFLRAQLARITHATEICPKGLFEIADEETGEVKMADEPPALGVEEAKSLEAWSHQQPIILKTGRCTHMAPVGMPEADQEEYLAKLAEEEKVERFRAIQEDAPIQGLEFAWITKVCGDNQ